MSDVKYPHVTATLVGEDGNAFFIMGRISKALRRADIPKDEIDKFLDEAKSGDYDNVLQTAMRWVNVE